MKPATKKFHILTLFNIVMCCSWFCISADDLFLKMEMDNTNNCGGSRLHFGNWNLPDFDEPIQDGTTVDGADSSGRDADFQPSAQSVHPGLLPTESEMEIPGFINRSIKDEPIDERISTNSPAEYGDTLLKVEDTKCELPRYPSNFLMSCWK
jgi:hypothetical protein